MPKLDYDYFGDEPFNKHISFSSLQEIEDRDAVRSIIEKEIYEFIGYHTIAAHATNVLSEEDSLISAIKEYSTGIAEKYLFGRYITTDKEAMSEALSEINRCGITLDPESLVQSIPVEYKAISYHTQYAMQKPTHKSELDKLKALREQLSSAIDEIDAVVGKNGQIQQNISTHEKQANEMTQNRKFSGPTL